MQLAEHRLGKPIEKYIADRYAKGETQEAIAADLNITAATLSRWMMQLGIQTFYGRKSAA